MEGEAVQGDSAATEAQGMEVEESGEASLVEGEAELHDESGEVEQNADEANNLDSSRKAGEVWQMRVCPILFDDFCKLKKEFTSMIKLTMSFEYRMSQHLCTKIEPGVWAHSLETADKDLPWLPNEKTYTKPNNAATAGMLEVKVHISKLLELMTLIRTADLSKRNRLRFELRRLPWKSAKVEEGKSEGDEEVKEEEGEDKPALLRTTDMLVNFAVRLKPVKVPAFSHPPGYSLKAEDKQIYLSRVSADIPDTLLEAILCSKLLVRQTAEDGTSTAVFQINSPFGAQGYMELFDGILVNYKDIEMSTSLGTLYDSKKKHSEKEQERRQANEKQQAQAVKRRPDSSPAGPQTAKKPREELDPISQIWVRGREVSKGVTVRGTPTRGRGTAQQARGVGQRTASQGRGGQGAVRGARGGLQTRMQLARGGSAQRITTAWRGRGARGGQQAPQRGVERRLSAGSGQGTPSRVFVRGGTRGLMIGRGGRGVLRREPISPRAGGAGYSGIDDLQAKLIATERELDLLQQEARFAELQTLDRGAVFRDDPFGPRGGFDPYDRGLASDFLPPPRRRW